MQKIFVFILVLISTSACRREEIKPSLSEQKMTAILVDIHIAEGAMQNLTQVKRDSLSGIYYEQIFEIHDIKPQDYVEMMQYLKKNPKKMEALYKKVLEKLELMTQKVQE